MRKEYNKTYLDDNGYLRYKNSNKLVHRWLAYKHLYMPNKDRYINDFSAYVVHHKDGNKMNNDPSNLEIMHERQHAQLHGHNDGLLGIIDRILSF